MSSRDLIEDDPTVDVGGVLLELGVGSGGPVVLAGRYLLLALLGTGGMGTVYRARDLELEEEIAVKVLRRELAQSPTIVARFRQEVKLARRVTHRNVARTFDIGEHRGERFITMEYVDGESLADRLARRGRLPLGEALDLSGSICAGLSAAHAAGVVHRDLKPENVLIESNGRVVLTDFGLALTFEDAEGDTVVEGSADLVGTPVYMAPEQVEAKVDVDARADVYALGAMLYEMLSGERPWRGETAWAVASARLHALPPDPRLVIPALPEALARIVMTAMALSRDDRYLHIDDLAAELASVIVPSGPPSHRGLRPSLPSMPDLYVDLSAKTVAVLPFAWAADEDAPFAYAMMLDLIARLWSLDGLRVRGPRSTAGLAARDRDVRSVGQSLGVQAVVDGAVRRAGGRIQIVARLTAVADGFQLWASRLERDEREWFELVDDVVQGVMGPLSVRERGSAPALPNLGDAIQDYVAVRQQLALAEIDPSSAPAHLSEAERLLLTARAHISRGAFAEGARSLREALRAAPGHPEIQALFGRLLALGGRPRQGLTFLEAALGLEPSLGAARRDALFVQALLGDFARVEGALAEPSRGREDDVLAARLALWHPDPGFLHAAARASQLAPEARTLASLLSSAAPALALVEARLAGLGSDTTSDRRIAAAQEAAEAYAAAGDTARALALVEEAVALGLTDITWLERCPALAPLGAELGAPAAEVARRAEAVRAALRSGGGRA